MLQSHKLEPVFTKALADLGNIYGIKGDYLQAVRYLMKSLAIYEKNHSFYELVVNHIRLFLTEAEKRATEINANEVILITNVNLGNIYFQEKNFKKAREYYLKANELRIIKVRKYAGSIFNFAIPTV